MEEESGKVAKIEYVASLSRHTKAVNVVRFSPCGKITNELLVLHKFMTLVHGYYHL